mgnify:CR=1 FL=1
MSPSDFMHPKGTISSIRSPKLMAEIECDTKVNMNDISMQTVTNVASVIVTVNLVLNLSHSFLLMEG